MAMAVTLHSPATAANLWAAPRHERRRGGSRIVCRSSREDAARKALEQALGGKKDEFSKWDEEIRRREAASRGSGGGRGRFGGFGGFGGGGGGGGGGGDGGPANEGSWEEAKQVVLAVTGLIGILVLMTNGKRSLVLLLNLPRYMLMGGKRGIAFLLNMPLLLRRAMKRKQKQKQKQEKGEVPVPVTASSSSEPQPQSAKAHVINKWGRD